MGGKVGGHRNSAKAQTAQKKQQRSASAGGAAGGAPLGCSLLPFDLVSAPGGWDVGRVWVGCGWDASVDSGTV